MFKEGMLTRSIAGEVVDGSFKAGEEIAFGVPLKMGTSAGVAVLYSGSSSVGFLGFAAYDGTGSLARDAQGNLIEKTSYQSGDPIAVVKKGFVALKVAEDVSKGKKIGLTTTGGIVDESSASAAIVLNGTMFTQDGSANSIVEAEINLPS